MQTASPSLDILQAVFSVCASREDCAALVTAAGSISGCEFAGEFQEYITADRRPQFSSALKSALGVVALVDCDRDPELALETMERLQQTFPQKIRLVAIGSNSDAKFLLQAMRAGCNDFLPKPVQASAVTEILVRFQNGLALASNVTQSSGRVISLFGVKGGVGTTALAVHLAMHLVRRHHKKVLLIDHKHELGHVSLYLGLKGGMYYFEELIRNVDRLDADLLDGFVVRHASGLEVLPSPDNCALLTLPSNEAVERVMDHLRQVYDFVLVDSTMQNRESVGPMMAASDEVVVVGTPDVAALRDLARYIENLSLVNGFMSKLRVVINRSTSEDAVGPEQIEQAVRVPVAFTVPNNHAELMRAINAGEPIAPTQKGPFSQAIAKWANALANGAAVSTAPSKSRKLFKLFG